jgi:hypothetical protein
MRRTNTKENVGGCAGFVAAQSRFPNLFPEPEPGIALTNIRSYTWGGPGRKPNPAWAPSRASHRWFSSVLKAGRAGGGGARQTESWSSGVRAVRAQPPLWPRGGSGWSSTTAPGAGDRGERPGRPDWVPGPAPEPDQPVAGQALVWGVRSRFSAGGGGVPVRIGSSSRLHPGGGSRRCRGLWG